MVSKKILGVAIAAAFSSQAFAVVDLNDKDAAGSKVVFAKEALLNTAAGTVVGNDNGTYYKVGGASNAVLDFKVKYGTGIANTQKRFVRVDLQNAVFTSASALASTTTLGSTATAVNAPGVLVQGGQAKDTYAILEVTAAATVAQDDTVNVNVDELAISGVAGVGITATVYETLTAAVNQSANTALNTKNLAGVITTATGIDVATTANTVTASVDAGFKTLVANGAVNGTNWANLGTVTVAAKAGVLDRDTTAATLADLINIANSKVKLSGDFSVGVFSINAADAVSKATAEDNTAPDALVTYTNTSKTTSTDIALADWAAAPILAAGFPGDKVIPKGSYTAQITFAGIADAAFAPAAVTTTVGTVAHNGTTIQVPYVTTYADYAQRLVLVNRGGADAAYSITFTPEAGVTATAGTAATGTIPAGKTVIVAAKDVVTLTGATRTAATINVVAVSTNIDAATTSVNLADKSTDTVKLQ